MCNQLQIYTLVRACVRVSVVNIIWQPPQSPSPHVRTCRVQQLMLSNTIVKLLAVFGFATPAVLVGGELYSLLQPNTTLTEGFLKIYSVLYIIPGRWAGILCV